MTLKHVLTLAALLAALSLAWGQVTITQGSLAPVGTVWTTYTLSDATFNAGSAGTNQTWTFGEYTFDNSGTGEVVDPATTPYTADFPTANHVLSSGGDYYTFYRTTANAGYWLGTASSGEPLVFDDEAFLMPFPCSYGSAWTTVTQQTFTIGQFTIVMTDSMINSVDGWGTLQTQYGNHPVIRVFSHIYMRTDNGVTPPEEIEFLSYLWYAASGVDVASVMSYDNETDPNFTTGFLEISDLTVPAGEPRGPVAQNFAVGQNYPNPFNPATALPLTLERQARVTMKIYDETGRLVSQEEFELPAGQHQLPVNGSRWSTGTYFANISAGADQQTVKMQLVK